MVENSPKLERRLPQSRTITIDERYCVEIRVPDFYDPSKISVAYLISGFNGLINALSTKQKARVASTNGGRICIKDESMIVLDWDWIENNINNETLLPKSLQYDNQSREWTDVDADSLTFIMKNCDRQYEFQRDS